MIMVVSDVEHVPRFPTTEPHLGGLDHHHLTAGDLITTPVWTVEPELRASDVVALLSARGFDVAGVGATKPTHFVQIEEIRGKRGPVRKFARPILASECTERSLPLSALLERLAERPFVFVLDDQGVGGIVTHSDLQAPAVGLALFGSLLRLEASLATLVQAELGDAWFESLSEQRRRKLVDEYERRRRDHSDIGLADSAYLADWIRLARNCAGLRDRLGVESKAAVDRLFAEFEPLRNALAHGRSILDAVDPRAALARIERLKNLTRTLDAAVSDLSPLWDAIASSIITVDVGDGQTRRIALTGQRAVESFPFRSAIHVISAWNPGGVLRSTAANREANRQLASLLESHGHSHEPCLGSSLDESWKEEAFIVHGLRRVRAAELGTLFGQRSVFELDSDNMQIVLCATGRAVRTLPRRQLPRTTSKRPTA